MPCPISALLLSNKDDVERILAMDDLLLMRLRDCSISTRLGVADQGFPDYMRRLAALGYVTQVGSGFKVTAAGAEYLKSPSTVERLRKL